MQQWLAVRRGTQWQLCVEGDIRNPTVRHSTGMTDPMELCSDDECFNTRYFTFAFCERTLQR